MSCSFDADAEVGDRVRDLLVVGDPPRDDIRRRNEQLVRDAGGGSMVVDAENAREFGPDHADVTAEYLAENVSHEPSTDGRIPVAE